MDTTAATPAAPSLAGQQAVTSAPSDAGCWVWYPARNDARLDARSLALFGLLAETFDGTLTALRTVTLADDRPLFDVRLHDAVTQRAVYQAEFRVRHPDTGVRWLLSIAQPALDADGAVVLSGVSIDMTQRYVAEERLRALQEVTASFAEAQTLADVRQIIFADLVRALGASGGGLRLVVGQELVVVAHVLGTQIAVETLRQYSALALTAPHPAAEAVRTGDAVLIGSAAGIVQRYPDLTAAVMQQSTQATAHLPLRRGSAVFGVLSFSFAEPHDWEGPERDFVLTLANRTAVSYERARLFEAEQRAAAENQRQARLFDTTLATISDYVYTFDADGRFVYANQTLLDFWQLPRDAAIGKTMAELDYPAEVAATLLAGVRAVFASGQTVQNETLYTTTTGQSGYYENILSPVFASDGQVIVVTGCSRDVTERTRRERNVAFIATINAALAALTAPAAIADTVGAQLSQYLGVVRVTTVTFDPDQTRAPVLYDWRAAHEPAVGAVDADDVTSYGSPEYLHELAAGRAVVIGDLRTHLFTAAAADTGAHLPLGAAVSVPYHSDGQLRFVLSAYHHAPYRWRVDEIELLRDLAERIWIRLERARAHEALRASEERYRALTELSAHIVWVLNQDATIAYLSPRWFDLTGIPVETTRQHGWMEVIHPDDRARVRQDLTAYLTAGAAYVMEMRLRTRADDYRWHLTRATPITAANGTIMRWLGVTFDIDDRKQAENALRDREARLAQLYVQEQAARAAAEEANRVKDDFLATVSHELRTPLTTILGYAQLLQSRKRDEAYLARTLEKMVRSAHAQSKLIDDLLDVSRIISGKLRIEPQQIDLAQIMRTALDTIRPTAEAKGLVLEAELDVAVVLILGDPNRLHQLMGNLLANAAKFTPAGGTITVALVQQDATVEVSVRDTGQGISPAFLPYVFDRFRQADGSRTRSADGLGLGLAIVQHIVALHGGTVAAASAGLDQGSTFTVRLPRNVSGAAPAALDRAMDTDDAARDELAELRGLRVLVVDDKIAILELLNALLTPCGVVVQQCLTAREALATLRVWRPDVLIADIAMPGEDGYWLIGELRALPPDAGGTIPAIAFTAYARTEDQVHMRTAGFQYYLAKPIDIREVLDVLVTIARDTDGAV